MVVQQATKGALVQQLIPGRCFRHCKLIDTASHKMDNLISTNVTKGLSELPAEMLYCIADQLDYTWDISTLCLVNRRLYEVLNPYLYIFNKQYTPHTVLGWAVKHGRRQLVEILFGDSVRDTPEGLATWSAQMQSASQQGHVNVAELLLDMGRTVFPSHFPRMLNPMLRDAIEDGHEPIVRLLLQHGALLFDLHTPRVVTRGLSFKNLSVLKTLIEYSPPSSIALAVLFCHVIICPLSSTPEMVDLCLERGADLATRTGDGKSLLYLAVHGSNPETVRHLLRLGGGLGLPGGTRLEPLTLALRIGNLDIASILLEQVSVNEILADGREIEPLLFIAASYGSVTIVQQLLQSVHAPDLFKPSSYPGSPGNKALLSAASFGQVATARLLLEQGAKPQPEALLCALEAGCVPLVEMLLEAGVDPNYNDTNTRRSALRLAAKDESLLRLLVAHGAGQPPARWPARIWEDAIKGGIPQVQMLLEQDKTPKRDNRSFLSRVVKAGVPMLDLIYGDAYNFSKRHIRRIQPSLPLQAIQKPDIAAFDWLVRKGFSKMISGHELCELFFALFAYFDLDDAVQGLDLLLAYGADINTKATTGHRAIWVGMTHGVSEPVLKVLLERGADPSLRRGETPEHVAERLSSTQGLEFLLEEMLRVWDWNDMREVLSILKSKANDNEHWPQVRMVEQFEYRHGFGFGTAG